MENNPSAEFLAARRNYSKGRLEQVTRKLAAAPELGSHPGFFIYVCGSYGRLEASKSSDLDLFFIECPRDDTPAIGQIDRTLINAAVVVKARELDFPEFSNDGQYLETHSLGSILAELGGRTDDYENFFTARLLLLLESRPVFGADAYWRAVREVIATYYRDYHDHEKDFQPIFVLNDIIRFWKSLCLNYEHKRSRHAETDFQKSKHHLRNFKLKFSRLLTCYSMVIPLVARGHTSAEELLGLVALTPLDRLAMAAEREPARNTLERIRDEYVWFLRQVEDPDTILSRLADRSERNTLFERGRQFTGTLYLLLRQATESNDKSGLLRYIVM